MAKTIVTADQGGTGQFAYTVGDIVYANTTASLAKLAASTDGYVLTATGAGSAPAWEEATGSSTFSVQNFTGDGVETDFTLSEAPVSEDNTQVYVTGVYQQKNTYGVSGTTLAFGDAPADTADIEVVTISTSSIGTTTANLVTFSPTGTGAVDRTTQAKLRDVVSVKDFGAVGNGINDDTAEIQAALNSGAKAIYLPTGTYKVTDALTVPLNVSMYGDGMGATIIDASSTTTASNLTNGTIKTPDATYTALPALSTAISRHDHTLTFASAPSVSVGDVIVLYNDTDYSWSGHRDYYRAGEMVKVASISSSTVTIQGAFAQDYEIADIDLYKLTGTTCFFRDFAIIGLPDSATVTKGLCLIGGIDFEISNVKSTNSSYVQINPSKCFGGNVTNCVVEEDFSNDHGGDYGFSISNSSHIHVEGGYFSAVRHGIAIGGGSGIGCVINRYITVNNSTISTTGNAQAMDWHGNCEWITITNCTIDGGLTPGGNNFKIDGNLIRGHSSNGDTLCYVAELEGTNISISNNIFYQHTFAAGRGAFIDIGGNSNVISDKTKKGGTINISDNTFHWDFTPLTENGYDWITITNRGYTGDEVINVSINDNTLTTKNKHGDYGLSLAQHGGQAGVRWYSGDSFNSINFTGNSVTGAAGLHAFGDGSAYAFKNVNIGNNLVSWSSKGAFRAEGVEDSISFIGNNCVFSPLYCVSLTGVDTTDRCKVITCTGNSITQGAWKTSGSSVTDASFFIYYAEEVFFHNNFAGCDATSGTVSDNTGFTKGETITGSSSGATAKLAHTQSTTTMLFHNTAVGTFTESETVTGNVSSASTTITSHHNSYYYLARLGHITNVWRDNNIDFDGKGYSTTTITSDNTTI